MSKLRELIEAKIESAKNELYSIQYKLDTAVKDPLIPKSEQYELLEKKFRVIACIEAYTDILCLKELTELEHKAEKYDAYDDIDGTLADTIHRLQKENEILKEYRKDYLNRLKNLEEYSLKLEQENERIKNNTEWCKGCKEYDNENHCCHRYSHFIKRIDNECKVEIEELIKENRVLKDGFKALGKKYIEDAYKQFAFFATTGEIVSSNLIKVKALLEVMEE